AALALVPVFIFTSPAQAFSGHLLDHHCVVIGSDANYEGVTCADIYSNPSTLGWSAYGVNEVLCQTRAGAIADCQAIEETAATCSLTAPCATKSVICGKVFGHSDCGKRRVEN